ncbi:MAG: glycosyltransferase family 4 protein [Candidatus Omnitrophica bacterium]|nr:glycosyltransferase family 4 protein [Candidatus Omnitrophota bacterium]
MINRIKVAHIITRLDPGGSSTNTIETVARLNKERYDCTLIYGRTRDPDLEIQNALKERGIRFLLIDSLQRSVNPLQDFTSFIKLLFHIKKAGYQIVHTHTSKAGLLGRWAAKWAGVKCIVHTPHGHVFYGYFNAFWTRIFIALERWAARFTDKIITLTELGKKEHVQFKIAGAEKFLPIYSGIDVKVLETHHCDVMLKRRALNLPGHHLVFGTVARLEPIKGISFLVQAMSQVVRQVPNSRLLIVGDGAERPKIEGQIRALGLENHVILAGFRHDVPELLQVMDVFVLPSLNEGMGRVILEAMAFEKPVIASRTGGIPEIVCNGKTGLLTIAGDSRSLSDAMLKLAFDDKLRKEFGREGRKFLKDVFAMDKMVEKIDLLYMNLLKG